MPDFEEKKFLTPKELRIRIEGLRRERAKRFSADPTPREPADKDKVQERNEQIQGGR